MSYYLAENIGHRFTVVRKKGGGVRDSKLYLDEMPLHGVVDFTIKHSTKDAAMVTITFFPSGVDMQEVP